MSFSLVVLMAICFVVGTGAVVQALAQDPHTPAEPTVSELLSPHQAGVAKFAMVAAAAAFAFGAIGAGFAIAHVGAAAMGAIAEKPEIAGQALIFIALAEGLVVFGFITALMILGKI